MVQRINVTPGEVRELLVNLGRVMTTELIIAGGLTDVEIDSISSLFDPWKSGQYVDVGALRTANKKLYKCIQAHTTQSDWRPEATPALWAPISLPGVVADWVQPESTNPYMIGDKVVFEGHIWQSKIDTNVWSPTSYPAGWEDLGVV